MTFIAGHPFLTDFQKNQLLNNINQATNINQASINQTTNCQLTDIISQQVFIFSTTLSKQEQKKAIDLLNDGKTFELMMPTDNQRQLIVSPRFGTISPGARTPTDMCNSCEIALWREERFLEYCLVGENLPETLPHDVEMMLYDRMTQSLFYDLTKARHLFDDHEPAHLNHVNVMGLSSQGGREALESANREFGFALSHQDMDYLMNAYVNELKRNPTDVELMMFAQANSEHCRHKIFNAQWIIDGEAQPKSLFDMIKNTFQQNSNDILSAYKDNAAVIKGHDGQRFYPLLNRQNNH